MRIYYCNERRHKAATKAAHLLQTQCQAKQSKPHLFAVPCSQPCKLGGTKRPARKTGSMDLQPVACTALAQAQASVKNRPAQACCCSRLTWLRWLSAVRNKIAVSTIGRCRHGARRPSKLLGQTAVQCRPLPHRRSSSTAAQATSKGVLGHRGGCPSPPPSTTIYHTHKGASVHV